MWKVIKQPKTQGAYYVAQWMIPSNGRGKARKSVGLGYLDAQPQVAQPMHGQLDEMGLSVSATGTVAPVTTADLTARLREVDPDGLLPDAGIIAICERRGTPTMDPGGSWYIQFSTPTPTSTSTSTPNPAARAKVPDGTPTLGDFHHATWWPHRARSVEDATVNREEKLWGPILAALGPVPLGHLDSIQWSDFLASKTTWSPTSKRLAKNAYRCALSYAVELGVVPQVHPMADIVGASKPVLPPGEALTPEEISALCDAAADPMHRALFAVTFGMGLRPSEPTGAPSKRSTTGWKGGLQWDMLDFPRGTIQVPGTKNESAAATVHMSPFVAREMRSFWESVGSPRSGMVFTFEGKPIVSWRVAFERSLMRAGLIPYPPKKGEKKPEGQTKRRIIRYSGRYSFATLAATASVQPGAIRKAMRHSSRSTILERVYERLSVEQTREAFASFPDLGGK